MKKSHLWLGLCLLLALVVAQTGSVAQPAADASPATVRAAGEKIRVALISGDYETIYNNLRPAGKGRVALLYDRFQHELGKGKVTDDDAASIAKDMDPQGKLAIQSVKDLQALRIEGFFGLASGILRFAATRKASEATMVWYLVEQGIAYSGSSFGQETAGLSFYGGGLSVGYETRDGSQLALTFEQEGQSLLLASYALETENSSLTFSTIRDGRVDGNRTLTNMLRSSGILGVRRMEGEMLCGSGRDYCRVMYSKTGAADDVSDSFEDEADAGTFDGQYFRIRRYHPRLPNSSYDAALEIIPVDEADGFGLMTFKWGSGDSVIEWFDTRRELNDHIESLTEEPKVKEEPK